MLILIILFFPCTVTQLGQFKYGLVKNKITGEVNLEQTFTPGRYWIGFWKEFIEFSSVLNTIEFSDERPEENVQHLSKLISRDSDGKQITMDVSIQYRLQMDQVGTIYRDMTTLYEDVYISDLRDQFSKAMNQFAVVSVWTKYAEVSQQLFQRCKTILALKHATCWGLQLWRVGISQRYTDTLVDEQVKKQAQLTAEYNKTQAETRAETDVILANWTKEITIIDGESQAIKIDIERGAMARAEGELVKAQSEIIQLVKDIVSLEKVTNGTYEPVGNGTSHMSDEQLLVYQKYTMLQEQAQSHLVVNLADGLGSLNGQASQQFSGSSRRLGELWMPCNLGNHNYKLGASHKGYKGLR